jgi:hypothetical protein
MTRTSATTVAQFVTEFIVTAAMIAYMTCMTAVRNVLILILFVIFILIVRAATTAFAQVATTAFTLIVFCLAIRRRKHRSQNAPRRRKYERTTPAANVGYIINPDGRVGFRLFIRGKKSYGVARFEAFLLVRDTIAIVNDVTG